MRQSSEKGFSLVEVLVGASILLVAALAVAFMTKGRHIPQLDSLKACQDVNEEVLAAINSLGQGSFSYTYGRAHNSGFATRHCAGSVCQEGELGLDSGQRWPPLTELTSAEVKPTVRPHYLQLGYMNYLATLYNQDASYCTDNGRDLPGRSAFNFFQSDSASNLLKDRARYGTTRMTIRLVNEKGDTSCNRPFHIRPQAQGRGSSSPVLDAGIVNPLTAARVGVGFRVEVKTTYQDSGESGDPKVCGAQKNFFFQPESYRGQITRTENQVYPDPSSPLSARGLPRCDGGEPVVALNTSFTKAKKDSVLLCRNRSVVGNWPLGPVPCELGSATPQCTCDQANGCFNTWPNYTTDPDAAAPTLTSPNDQWVPCDLLGAQLLTAGIIQNASDFELHFNPAGNGTFDFVVHDLAREAPQRLPKKLRVDVIEIDSALNSSNDLPTSPFATFEAEFKGRDPGTVCEVCDSTPTAYEFRCGACPTCCDSSTTCCDGDSWPSNPNCPCTGPGCGDPCDDWADQGFSSQLCCETNNADPSCPNCDSCTDPNCDGYNPNKCSCPDYADDNPAICAPDECVESDTVCCQDGQSVIDHWCAADPGPGDGESWWSSRKVCKFPNTTPPATQGSWDYPNYPTHSNCTGQICTSGRPKLCDPEFGCYCL